MTWIGQSWLSLIAVLATGIAVQVPSAAAVVYETPTPFCDGGKLRDHLAPFKRMPKLRSPSPKGHLPFGPENLRLLPFRQLLVGEGFIGYRFFPQPKARGAQLNWDATTVLARVDWRGRVTATVDEARRHIGGVWRSRGGGMEFTVGGEPGVYRVTVDFKSKSGHLLGRLGFYFRVVRPFRRARLGLNASIYAAGSTVFGRVENLGTSSVFYGTPFEIERFDGVGWSEAPESPDGLWLLPLFGTGPGEAGRECSGFRIPVGMPPGHYRMSKEIEYATGTLLLDRGHRSTLTAEFEINP